MKLVYFKVLISVEVTNATVIFCLRKEGRREQPRDQTEAWRSDCARSHQETTAFFSATGLSCDSRSGQEAKHTARQERTAFFRGTAV